MTSPTPAQMLEGLEIEGGWRIGKRVPNPPSTGGHFSESYLVEAVDGSGRKAFLKALDFSAAQLHSYTVKESHI